MPNQLSEGNTLCTPQSTIFSDRKDFVSVTSPPPNQGTARNLPTPHPSN